MTRLALLMAAARPDSMAPGVRLLTDWLEGRGASGVLIKAAAAVALCEADGHTCVDLAALNWTDGEIQHLVEDPLVGNEDQASPFVLNSANLFYLRRSYDHEQSVVQHLRRLLDAGVGGDQVDEPSIDALFNGARGPEIDGQRRAVARSLGRRLVVVTGGAGTGKTSTVVRQLLLRCSQSPQPLVIELAAPTGKAAQRLTEAVRIGKDLLRPHLQGELLDALDRFADSPAKTLHRLLGYSPSSDSFRRNRNNPLGANLVVVDEVSMVDLALLRRLLDALKPDCALILLGDADQLSPVGAGSAFRDIVDALQAKTQPESVQQHVSRLEHVWRSVPELVVVAAAAQSGNLKIFFDAIDASHARAQWIPVQDGPALAACLDRWADLLVADWHPSAAVDTPADALWLLRNLRARQLLCAAREGVFGSLRCAAELERRLRSRWQLGTSEEWFSGRSVIVTANDYGRGLFNGDVGLALRDGRGALQVWFESSDESDAPTARAFPPHALPSHTSALALTVHKSQGSEYGAVALLLPPTETRVLNRQLLYTGLSRARERLELWASRDSIALALETVARRITGLTRALGGERSLGDSNSFRR